MRQIVLFQRSDGDRRPIHESQTIGSLRPQAVLAMELILTVISWSIAGLLGGRLLYRLLVSVAQNYYAERMRMKYVNRELGHKPSEIGRWIKN